MSSIDVMLVTRLAVVRALVALQSTSHHILPYRSEFDFIHSSFPGLGGEEFAVRDPDLTTLRLSAAAQPY